MTSNKSYRVKCGTNRDSHLYQWALPAVTVTVAELHFDIDINTWSVTSLPRCRRQKWQVTPTAATQVAWTTHMQVVVVHATHLGGPLPFMAAAAREQLRRRSQRVRTATLRLDQSSPERVLGNLFPSREIYFAVINNRSHWWIEMS